MRWVEMISSSSRTGVIKLDLIPSTLFCRHLILASLSRSRRIATEMLEGAVTPNTDAISLSGYPPGLRHSPPL